MRIREAAAALEVAPSSTRAPRSSLRPGVGSGDGLGWLTFPRGLAGAPVPRDLAMSVPACAQGVTLIASAVGGLPLYRWRDRERLETPDAGRLIRQPDPELPAVTTYTDTVADMVLHGAGYWLTLERSAVDDRPLRARHVAFDVVDDDPELDPDHVRVDGEVYARRDVLRFDGPLPGGILTAGAGVLLTAWLWERAAQRYALSPMPSVALVDETDADLDDDEVDAMLADYDAARRESATAYLKRVRLEKLTWSSSELQLVDARRDTDARIGQLLNLPPVYVNAPTASGSSTYASLETRRRDLLDLALAPYMDAIAGRLSLDDVTAHGQTVRHDASAFLRSDWPALVSLGVQAVDAGLLTDAEWRRMAGLPDRPQVGALRTPSTPGVSP